MNSYGMARYLLISGDLLIVERPYSTVLYPDFHSTHCMQCFCRLLSGMLKIPQKKYKFFTTFDLWPNSSYSNQLPVRWFTYLKGLSKFRLHILNAWCVEHTQNLSAEKRVCCLHCKEANYCSAGCRETATNQVHWAECGRYYWRTKAVSSKDTC